MNNIIKNLLLALTLVCAIAFIVFCVQLIVQNRGVEPINHGLSASEGAQQDGDEDSGDDENGDDTSGDETGDDTSDDDNGVLQVTPRPPPKGERHELLVAADTKLIIYVQEELFDFTQGELDWWFTYTGGGVATLEISFMLVTAQGVAADAESFLNNYTGGSTSEFGGEMSIQGSALRGYYVSAILTGESFEAWIHTLPDSDIALVFVINYKNDRQREALYEILGTMDLT